MTTLAEAICKGLGIQITQAAAEPIFANEPFIAKALAAALRWRERALRAEGKQP